MNYEKINLDLANGSQDFIIIDNGDGSFKSFPADESNPEYVAFLEALDAEEE
jgi:hypothetical protein